MKKLSLLVIKSLITVFVGTVIISCGNEDPIPIPVYTISKVSMFERNNIKTYLGYGNSRLNEYRQFEDERQVNSAFVYYAADYIYCTFNDVKYEIEMDNVKGGVRAKTVTATKNGFPIYNVYYNTYDQQGRLTLARVDGVGGQSIYISYKYEGNKIVISDGTTLELSSDDNKGNVCNVLDFAGSSYTSDYVINPCLYFLNIYGTPINKLPVGQEVEYSEDNQKILRVGKYTYEY